MNNSIAEYIQKLPPPMQQLGWHLRELILDQHPSIYEKWSFNTPFFYYRKYMVYLSAQKGYWVVGFTNGKDMADTEHYRCERLKLVLKVFVPVEAEIHPEIRWKVQEAIAIQDDKFKEQ